ncbi:hypothetical protein HMPREF0102_02943 [Bacteroides sp. 2_1_22]|nr:hypothetical protein HMPREF0102_02943 [Bacteroides sp. 2_1_22]
MFHTEKRSDSRCGTFLRKRLLSNIHTAYMNKNNLITAYSCAILLTFSFIH